MMNTFTYNSMMYPFWLPQLATFIALIALWSLFWKGLALWHAGRRGHVVWFIILLIVNTAGILDIIYLFFVLKLKFSQLFTSHHGSRE